MRAMVTPQYGAPDLFEERDVEMPRPGPGEVLVRLVASGTNPIDAKFRAAGGSRGLEAPIILGADVSGVVEEVGPGVTDLTPGDEVYYTPEVSGPHSNGGYAEYHVTKAGITARKPPSLSPEEAAGVPLAGGTAYEAIVRRLGVRSERPFSSTAGPVRGLLRHPDRELRRRPRPRQRRSRQPGDATGTRRAYDAVQGSLYLLESGEDTREERETLLVRAERTGDPELARAVYQVAAERGERRVADAYLERRPQEMKRWEEYVAAKGEVDALNSIEGILGRAMGDHLPKPPELQGYTDGEGSGRDFSTAFAQHIPGGDSAA